MHACNDIEFMCEEFHKLCGAHMFSYVVCKVGAGSSLNFNLLLR